jgi:transposase-like protein
MAFWPFMGNEVNAAAGRAALAAFDTGLWGRHHPAIGQSWQRAWNVIVPFYDFPGDVQGRSFAAVSAGQPMLCCHRRACT